MSIRRAARARNVRGHSGAGVPPWAVLVGMSAEAVEAEGARVGVTRKAGENLMAYKGRLHRAGSGE